MEFSLYPYIPMKKVMGEGRGVLTGGSACLIFWPWFGRLFGGGFLLELGRLFEEIRYLT